MVKRFGGKRKSAVETPPRIKRLLVSRPSHYNIRYSINPWMDVGKPADQKIALEQWTYLHDRFEEFGAELVHIRQRQECPDMVFTANGGLVFKEKKLVVLSNFFHEERKFEEFWFREMFGDLGYQIYMPLNRFEGAGDALFFMDHLIGGYGHRSDPEIYQEIRPLLDSDPLVVQLIDPRFYHLDTCFCPLADSDYLIYPRAFSEESLEKIRFLGGNEIALSDKEAMNFGCNAVVLGKTVILPSGCPELMAKLNEFHYNVVPVPMSEFIKSGGACKCLSLEI